MGERGLGRFELMVLQAAMRLGEDRAHSLAIVGEIEERTGRSVRRTAVYVACQRLEDKGLVTSWLADPRPERGGKGRRHIRPTATGLEAVRTAQDEVVQLWVDLEPEGAD